MLHNKKLVPRNDQRKSDDTNMGCNNRDRRDGLYPCNE
jgi:hypothetical protein